MGNAALIFFLAVVLLLINGVLPFPTETSTTLSPKIINQKSSDVQDSPLEHIHVKQETGFDGKVRSIRFSLEPENDKKPDDKRSRAHVTNQPKHQSIVTNTAATATPSSNIETSVDSTESTSKPEVPPSRNTRMVRVDETLPVNGSLLRSKRSIGTALSNNDLDDLQAEEAKVFRPLFVYRQQVARRLKLQNNKISGGDRRRTLRKSNNYGYYDPYHYYYPSSYDAYPRYYYHLGFY